MKYIFEGKGLSHEWTLMNTKEGGRKRGIFDMIYMIYKIGRRGILPQRHREMGEGRVSCKAAKIAKGKGKRNF